jgi:hypothetical protein
VTPSSFIVHKYLGSGVTLAYAVGVAAILPLRRRAYVRLAALAFLSAVLATRFVLLGTRALQIANRPRRCMADLSSDGALLYRAALSTSICSGATSTSVYKKKAGSVARFCRSAGWLVTV